MQFTGETEVRHSKEDDHPYINYRAEVVEPARFGGRTLFGMFWFPRLPASDAPERDHRVYEEQSKRVVGQVDAVLGIGTCASIAGEGLEAVLAVLVGMLDNEQFVGKVSVEKGKKVDPTDKSKDADRYPPRNRIVYFEAADAWVGEDDGEADPSI